MTKYTHFQEFLYDDFLYLLRDVKNIIGDDSFEYLMSMHDIVYDTLFDYSLEKLKGDDYEKYL